MENSDDLGDTVTDLRQRVAHLEWVLVGGVGIVLGVLMLLNVLAGASTHHFFKIFEDMIGGRPLPVLTQFVIGYGMSGAAGWISALLPLGSIIFLILARRTRPSWYVALGVLGFLFFQAIVFVIALWMPILSLIAGLGGQV